LDNGRSRCSGSKEQQHQHDLAETDSRLLLLPLLLQLATSIALLCFDESEADE